MASNKEIKDIYNALVHIHKELSYYYPNLYRGTRSSRANASIKMKQIIDTLGKDVVNWFYRSVIQPMGTGVKEEEDLIVPPVPKHPPPGSTTPATQKKSNVIEELIKVSDLFDKNGSHMLSSKVDNFLERVAAKGDIQCVDEKLDNLLLDVLGNRSVGDIIKFADFLDEVGAYTLSNRIDSMIKDAGEELIKPTDEITLSTRYCPDHVGVQSVRISENTRQCPIDGKTYNYESGYTNYEGQKVPGGSVSSQTPRTSNFGGIPMRIYDSRQNILNRIN
jgi:hypothetical protein